MIPTFRFPATVFALSLTGIFSQSTLEAQPSASLVDQITQRYTLTTVDPDGTVTQAGTAVSIGHYLLRANPIYGDRYQPNTYKKGRVSQPTFMKPSRDNVRLADSLDYISFSEKVYITRIDVTDSEVVFTLQTCTASPTRRLSGAIYRAALSFQFPIGSVNAANLQQIQNTIAEVFTVVGRGEAPGGSAETVAMPTPEQTAIPTALGRQPSQDIVHVGQAVDEVKALLGQPDKIENAGGKVTYSYTGLNITFTDGKVSIVQ